MFSSSISKCSIDYARQCAPLFTVMFFVALWVSTIEKSVIPDFDFFLTLISLCILLESVLLKLCNWYSQSPLLTKTCLHFGGVCNRPISIY